MEKSQMYSVFLQGMVGKRHCIGLLPLPFDYKRGLMQLLQF
jgi:hypothetical protein